MFAVGIGILVSDFANSRTELSGEFVRNSYGQGIREEELDVAVGNDKTKRSEITVEISERAYSGEELKSMFKRCTARLDKLILGDNQSLDHIESDLNLVNDIENMPVEISWELDRYDVMNVFGEIQETELSEEGTLITICATLTYRENTKEQMLYECKALVFPKSLSSIEKKVREIKEEIERKDINTQTKETFLLPKQLNGESISYFPRMNNRGAVLMSMAVLIGILLIALKKQNEEQKVREEKAQMQRDYPEIINKLTLFLGAGMTLKRAWRKIVADYDVEKELWGTRYAYEEMRTACNEMDSGIAEAESYERFGRRCGLQEYVKLGALLSQNLRKGTRDLEITLRFESAQSFEERKARAKRLGEEAGTKLLAPMFLMLAIVLVIVIVPAFMSVQM